MAKQIILHLRDNGCDEIFIDGAMGCEFCECETSLSIEFQDRSCARLFAKLLSQSEQFKDCEIKEIKC